MAQWPQVSLPGVLGWRRLPPSSSPRASCFGGGGLYFSGEGSPDTGVGSLLLGPTSTASASSSMGLGLGVGLRVGGSLVLFPTPNPLQLLSSPAKTVVLEGRETVILSWSLASDQETRMAVLRPGSRVGWRGQSWA